MIYTTKDSPPKEMSSRVWGTVNKKLSLFCFHLWMGHRQQALIIKEPLRTCQESMDADVLLCNPMLGHGELSESIQDLKGAL